MLTYPEIDPIIFSVGPLAVRWYGLMYVIGFLAAWFLARRRAEKPWSAIKPSQVDDLIFYSMLGVIAGGRLGYCLVYGWEYWLEDPLYVFKITQGGMSFHGGLVGVMVAMWLYGRSIGKGGGSRWPSSWSRWRCSCPRAGRSSSASPWSSGARS
jgi:phosphatidylglycerol:prolipoprotein diacylglycerol transferase